MKSGFVVGAVAGLAVASAAVATPTLQFDLNSFGTQAYNSAGAPSAFGGLSHTGSVQFSLGSGALAGIFIRTVPNGAFTNAGFSGSTLDSFTGQVNLTNGAVTGGSITVHISNGDSYTTNITSGSGSVSTFVGGGFKIEALTNNGFFNDAQFGNVNVGPWFAAQSGGGLFGSFLQFNFNPNASGAASSDMDLFVDVVPLPPAAWAGMATIAGVIAVRKLRRR
jgi:hypothetical protein